MNSSIIFYSTINPEAAIAALGNSIDVERKTLLSLSGYAGDRPVLGEITRSEFRPQKWKVQQMCNEVAAQTSGNPL